MERQSGGRGLIVARAAILLVALGVGGLGTELTLRRVLPSPREEIFHPIEVTWRFRPDTEVFHGVTGDAVFATNRYGLRGSDPSPDDGLKLVAIGGSTTECLLLDQTEHWPALVGQALNAVPGSPRLWVGNAGRSGASTRNHVSQVHELLGFYPDLDWLVVLVGVNDLVIRLARDTGWTRWRWNEDLTKPRRGFWADLLTEKDWPFLPWYKNTATWRLLAQAKRGLEFREAGVDREGAGLRQDNADAIRRWRQYRAEATRLRDELPPLEEALDEYRTNLRLIVEQAKGKGVKVLLLTHPALWQDGLTDEMVGRLWAGGVGFFEAGPGHEYYTVEAMAQGVRLYNQATREVADALGVPCLDLASQIPGALDYYYDDCHFTEAGAEQVAKLVTAYLLTQPPWSELR